MTTAFGTVHPGRYRFLGQHRISKPIIIPVPARTITGEVHDSVVAKLKRFTTAHLDNSGFTFVLIYAEDAVCSASAAHTLRRQYYIAI